MAAWRGCPRCGVGCALRLRAALCLGPGVRGSPEGTLRTSTELTAFCSGGALIARYLTSCEAVVSEVQV